MESRVATLEVKVEFMEKRIDKRDGNDVNISKRLSRIELALATGLGGLVVIAWLVNHSADNILRLLSR